MPLYEYQCDACGRRFELIRKYSDPPVEVCPTCNGVVHKLASSPAIQFKGSGFYITDYAKKSGAPAGEAKDSGDTKGGKGTNDTKDSKDSKDSKGSGDAQSSGKTAETSGKSSSSGDTAAPAAKPKSEGGGSGST